MNVNLLPMWICLPIFLYILFIYIYVGVEGVTHVIFEGIKAITKFISSSLVLCFDLSLLLTRFDSHLIRIYFPICRSKIKPLFLNNVFFFVILCFCELFYNRSIIASSLVLWPWKYSNWLSNLLHSLWVCFSIVHYGVSFGWSINRF